MTTNDRLDQTAKPYVPMEGRAAEITRAFNAWTPDQKDREIMRLRIVLRHIAVMDVYTRDGEEPPHELMRRLAWEAINYDR